MNLSLVVNIPSALRECRKKAQRVEGKAEEGKAAAEALERLRPGLSKSGIALLKEFVVPVFRGKRTGSECKNPNVEAIETEALDSL